MCPTKTSLQTIKRSFGLSAGCFICFSHNPFEGRIGNKLCSNNDVKNYGPNSPGHILGMMSKIIVIIAWKQRRQSPLKVVIQSWAARIKTACPSQNFCLILKRDVGVCSFGTSKYQIPLVSSYCRNNWGGMPDCCILIVEY